MVVTVYALRFDDGKIYVGLTKDFQRREQEHRRRQSPSTKRMMGNFVCVYFKEFDSYEAARSHEKFLKSGAGREVLASLVEHQGVPTPQALPR